jgi:ParB-like chromosome segregation protein Spo0J
MITEEVPIVSLKFAEYNPREITEHDFTALKNSIKEFGFNEKENC